MTPGIWDDFRAGLWEDAGPVFSATQHDAGRLADRREPSTAALGVVLFLVALAWGLSVKR